MCGCTNQTPSKANVKECATSTSLQEPAVLPPFQWHCPCYWTVRLCTASETHLQTPVTHAAVHQRFEQWFRCPPLNPIPASLKVERLVISDSDAEVDSEWADPGSDTPNVPPSPLPSLVTQAALSGCPHCPLALWQVRCGTACPTPRTAPGSARGCTRCVRWVPPLGTHPSRYLPP